MAGLLDFQTTGKSDENISTFKRVTTRVWDAILNGKQVDPKVSAVMGGDGVGHASLETSTSYLSHWPGANLRGPKIPVQSSYRSLPEDECCEGKPTIGQTRQIIRKDGHFLRLEEYEALIEEVYNEKNGGPQSRICTNPLRKAEYVESLYSLDVAAIEKEVEKIKEEAYQLKSKRKHLSLAESRPLNCAGAVYRALDKGGINKLSPEICGALKQYSIFSIKPGDIERCIRHAKQKELIKYPETAAFAIK